MKESGFLPRTIAAVIRWALSLRLVRAGLLYSEKRGSFLADSVTYRALFSVFAGAAVGLSAAALWLSGNDEAWSAVITAIETAVPGLIKHGDSGIIDLDLLPVVQGLSVASVISAAALVWASLGAIGSLRSAVRVLAGTAADDLLWIWVILRNLGLALAVAGSFLLGAALTVVGQTSVETIADFLGADGSSSGLRWTLRLVSLSVVLLLDIVLVAVVFRVMSGLHVKAKDLWTGAAIGGVGLVALQELSSLVVGGAKSNPLLVAFTSLLALLIWINFSTQVLLFSSAYIVTAHEEREDRVGNRYGAATFAQRRVRQAQRDVEIATQALRAAEAAEAAERTERQS